MSVDALYQTFSLYPWHAFGVVLAYAAFFELGHLLRPRR